MTIDIETLLEAYHKSTNEDKENTPYYTWISYKKQLPFDDGDRIIVFNEWNQLTDLTSFVALQHALFHIVNYPERKDEILSCYWMRVKLPRRVKRLKRRKSVPQKRIIKRRGSEGRKIKRRKR